jgi:hypothetical protein
MHKLFVGTHFQMSYFEFQKTVSEKKSIAWAMEDSLLAPLAFWQCEFCCVLFFSFCYSITPRCWVLRVFARNAGERQTFIAPGNNGAPTIGVAYFQSFSLLFPTFTLD